MTNQSNEKQCRAAAEAVRRACLEAAQEAYVDASIRGLCKEGAWESALEAIRSLDLDELLGEAPE